MPRENATQQLFTRLSQEKADRVIGDAESSIQGLSSRAFVPAGRSITLPDGWQILASEQFEIPVDAELAIDAGAQLRVMA